MDREMPAWLSREDNGVLVIDPDAAYPVILEHLGLPIDQYSLEVAYQCAKLKAQEYGEEDKTTIIHVLGGEENKKKWALSNHKEGKGIDAATKGREARQHYERIKNKL